MDKYKIFHSIYITYIVYLPTHNKYHNLNIGRINRRKNNNPKATNPYYKS